MAIQENVEALQQAMDAVTAHPMCGRLEDDGLRFIAFFPDGDFSTDGCTSRHDGPGGKEAALQRMLKVLEREWVNSYPGASRVEI